MIERSFTAEEAAELIEGATRLRHDADPPRQLSYSELVEIASEVGVSEDELSRALAARERAKREARRRAKAEAKAAKRSEKARRHFRGHAEKYAVVIGGLAVIDLVSGNGLDWVWYPAAGWGIGLALHYVSLRRRTL